MTVQWRKSSYTGGANDEHCVEVGRLAQGIGVRDSKNPDNGHLSLTTAQFAAMIDLVRNHTPSA